MNHIRYNIRKKIFSLSFIKMFMMYNTMYFIMVVSTRPDTLITQHICMRWLRNENGHFYGKKYFAQNYLTITLQLIKS